MLCRSARPTAGAVGYILAPLRGWAHDLLRRGLARGLADAPEVAGRPDEDLSARNSRGRVGWLAQRVFAHHVELVAGFDDVRRAVVVDEIHVPVGVDPAGAVVPAEAFLPLGLSRLGVEAGRDA